MKKKNKREMELNLTVNGMKKARKKIKRLGKELEKTSRNALTLQEILSNLTNLSQN